MISGLPGVSHLMSLFRVGWITLLACSAIDFLVVPTRLLAFADLPAFAVASVKAQSEWGVQYVRTGPDSVIGRNVTLQRLIIEAYSIRPTHVIGGPGWIFVDRYDVDAKADHVTDPKELRAMMQRLLQERFRLTIHRETRAVQTYALTTSKKGLAIARHGAAQSEKSTGTPAGQIQILPFTMSQLAPFIGRALDAVVKDETGVEGEYDVPLFGLSPEDRDSDVVVSWRRMLAPLGLKLEDRAKSSEEFIIVDSASKASPNQ